MILRPKKRGGESWAKPADVRRSVSAKGESEYWRTFQALLARRSLGSNVRKLIQIGVIAWNVSLDEETNPEEILEDVGIDKVEGAEFLRAFLLDLVDRKRFLFPYDGRDIVAWDVNPQPEGGFYIRAATLTVGE
jgi:hypothetical protein